MKLKYAQRAITTVLASVAVLTMAACSTTPTEPIGTEPAAPSTTAATATTQAAASVTALELPDPSNAIPNDGTPEAVQEQLAWQFANGVGSAGYTVSGDWVANGSKAEDIAALWANYLSPRLKDELASGKGLDKFPVVALSPSGSAEKIHAHEECHTGSVYCSAGAYKESLEGFASLNEEDFEPDKHAALPVAGIAATKFLLGVPAMTEAGGGYESSKLDLKLTFVPNTGGNIAAMPFLIDSVDATISDKKFVLADDPKKFSVQSSDTAMF